MDLCRGHLLTSGYKNWQIACQVFTHSVRVFFLSDRFPFHSISLLSLNYYFFLIMPTAVRIKGCTYCNVLNFSLINENVCRVQRPGLHFKVIRSIVVMMSCHRPQFFVYLFSFVFTWCTVETEVWVMRAFTRGSKRGLCKEKWSCQDGHLCKKIKWMFRNSQLLWNFLWSLGDIPLLFKSGLCNPKWLVDVQKHRPNLDQGFGWLVA